MAKIKYDVSDVEPGVDFDTPVPIGVYKCKIAEAKEDVSKSSGNDMIALTLQIVSDDKGGKEFKGRNIWDYIVLNDASEWKVRQLVDALDLPAKGSLDPREIIGEVVRVRVKHEPSEEFGTRAKVGSLLPKKAGGKDDDEPDDEDEAEAEATDDGDDEEWTLEELQEMDNDELMEVVEDEELDIEDAEDLDDDDLLAAICEELGVETEEEEEGPTYEEVQKMRMTQLKKLNKEEGLKVRITDKSKLDTVRDKVCEALGLEEESDDDDDDGEEVELTYELLSEIDDIDELKEIIDEQELEIRVTKRSKVPAIIEKIAEALDLEPEDDEEEEDYDSMSPADLKATCKERGLSAAGTKATLIKRLRKDDEEDGEPF